LASSLSFSKIVKAYNEARSSGQDLPRLCVVGAGAEHARVVDMLSAGADEARGGAHPVFATALPSEFVVRARASAPWDIVVFVAAGTQPEEMAPVMGVARAAGCRVIALIEGPNADAWARRAGFGGDEIARSVGAAAGGRPTLENRLVHAADRHAASLAAHLPAVRSAYCDHVILVNAKQNGVIGVVVVIPGADMPAMTANQIRMVLQIAAAYGEEIGPDRALEILSVVGSAFAFRALARQALVFVPGFGWVLKGAIGFTATLALGRAAVAYFEAGAPLQVSHMKRIEHQVERARQRFPGFLQRRMAAK
jgi:uncharacterized protein (DUF697 family)